MEGLLNADLRDAGSWPSRVVTDAMRQRMPVEEAIEALLEVWPDPTMCFQDYDDAERVALKQKGGM